MTIVLRVPRDLPQDDLRQIFLLAKQHPGGHPLRVEATKGPEPRKLTLGPKWAVNASSACLAALSEYGDVDEC